MAVKRFHSGGMFNFRLTADSARPGLEAMRAALLMLCSGCGGSVGEVSGRVFLDGQPLDGAIIQLKPKGNPEAKGMLDAKITADGPNNFIFQLASLGS